MVTNCFETHDIDWILFDSSIYWWDLYLHAIASYLFESRGEGGGTCRPYRPFRLKKLVVFAIFILSNKNRIHSLLGTIHSLPAFHTNNNLLRLRSSINYHNQLLIRLFQLLLFHFMPLSLSLSLWWQVLCSDYFSEKNPCDLSIPYDTTESGKQKRDL